MNERILYGVNLFDDIVVEQQCYHCRKFVVREKQRDLILNPGDCFKSYSVFKKV